MKKFYDLKIFHPMVMGVEYKKIQKSIIDMTVTVLLSKLNREQSMLLEIKNFYILIPDSLESRVTHGFLEHLVFDAIDHVGTLTSESDFKSEIFFHDLKKNFGFFYFDLFLKSIDEINEKWERLAHIEIINEHEENAKISFNLLSKFDL